MYSYRFFSKKKHCHVAFDEQTGMGLKTMSLCCPSMFGEGADFLLRKLEQDVHAGSACPKHASLDDPRERWARCLLPAGKAGPLPAFRDSGASHRLHRWLAIPAHDGTSRRGIFKGKALFF
jgi:hypothetical protein